MGFTQNSTYGFGNTGTDSSAFLNTANEGLSVNGTTVQLGQVLNDVDNPALIDESREIPFSSSGAIVFSDEAASVTLLSITLKPTSLALRGETLIDFQRRSAVNTNIGLSLGFNIFGFDDWAALNIYPSSGSDVASTVNIIPKGTGFGGELSSELWLFGTDFIVDSANYDAFYIRNSIEEIFLTSEAAGTGTAKPVSVNVGDNLKLLFLSTTGNIGVSTDNPLSKLEIDGGTVTGSDTTGVINAYTTWNTTGAPTAFRFQVSDSASNAASLMLDFITGNGSTLQINKTGTVVSMLRSIGSQANNCFAIRPQWTTSGSPTAFLINPTNSSSGASATLLDVQISNVSKFKVDKNGTATLTSSLTGSAAVSNLVITPTWNTSGTPTAVFLNLTDTASNANSLLLDLQVASTSRFKIRKDGYATMTNGTFFITRTSDNSDVELGGAGYINVVNNTSTQAANISFFNNVTDFMEIGVTGSGFVGRPNKAYFSSTLNMLFDTSEIQFGAARTIIGSGSATAILTLGASGGGVSGAPLKFTSGPLIATAETGAMEYNGTNLYFTRTGTTRENVFVGNDGAASPTTSPVGSPSDYYGTGDGAKYLSTPNSWAGVVINGVLYKIPLYT